MKKSVSFNEKLNKIIEYEKEKINHYDDYLSTINKYLNTENIKKDDKDDYEYIILKNGKRIKKNI